MMGDNLPLLDFFRMALTSVQYNSELDVIMLREVVALKINTAKGQSTTEQ